jgi:hypothetical protein
MPINSNSCLTLFTNLTKSQFVTKKWTVYIKKERKNITKTDDPHKKTQKICLAKIKNYTINIFFPENVKY